MRVQLWQMSPCMGRGAGVSMHGAWGRCLLAWGRYLHAWGMGQVSPCMGRGAGWHVNT